MKSTLFSFFLLMIGLPLLMAQEPADTSVPFDRLGQSDIRWNEEREEDQRVVSASRTLKSADDLPFTVYIITKEEIFDNNYTTLVDVLKTVPGIKVSQLGSALEGETFVMRGLLGNDYTKILINDLPIKPSAVSGLPIGAQLPIKEAERIEIIFGPAASIYGADASAGVINIITSQTERPIYAQADLSLGSNAYRHLNVMFGGKIGRGKEVLKFSAYGSNTAYEDRFTKYDAAIYNPAAYGNETDTAFVNNPNFAGTATTIPLGELPHESRSLGLQLKYRSLSFAMSQMYRQDHSSVGLSPRAVAYDDPTAFSGETINTARLGIQNTFEKWGFITNLNYVGYQMNNQSSTIYVDNTLAQLLNTFVSLSLADEPALRDSIIASNYFRFFSNERYRYAKSTDIQLEQLVTLFPAPFLEVTTGGTYQRNTFQPYIDYLPEPYDEATVLDANDSLNQELVPIFVDDATEQALGLFTQFYFSFQKLNIIAGVRYDWLEGFGESFSPRIAAIYKFNPNFSIHASSASAYRKPSSFYGANTYIVDLENYGNFNTNPFDLLSERTITFDLGIRAKLSQKIKISLSFFASRTSRFLSPLFLIEAAPDEDNVFATIGYGNDENSRIALYGTQARIIFENISEERELDLEANLNFNRGNEILPFSGVRLEQVRMQPDFFGQVKISFKLLEKLYVNMNNLFSTAWLSRNLADVNRTDILNDRTKVQGFYTFDLMGKFRMTSSFNAFAKIKNVLNRDYGGIGATGTFDDLIYNPQLGRTIELGMSYRMQ